MAGCRVIYLDMVSRRVIGRRDSHMEVVEGSSCWEPGRKIRREGGGVKLGQLGTGSTREMRAAL